MSTNMKVVRTYFEIWINFSVLTTQEKDTWFFFTRLKMSAFSISLDIFLSLNRSSKIFMVKIRIYDTGKSLSEALIFASINMTADCS